MANQEHVDILMQGVEIWNQWRKEHVDITPNLSGANLKQIDLYEIDLSRANLSGADLSNVDLSHACGDAGSNFSGADLSGANLSGANLSMDDLSATNLEGANLQGAYLAQTDFSKANLSRANLNGADFSTAYVDRTLFVDVDLSTAKGLDTILHSGPSTIGIDTIYRSQGYIPEVFLREAGVPDLFITYARSLISQPIDYYSCFISYSSRDEAFVKRLYADLQSKGVRCWFAPKDLKTGDKIRMRIDESIRLYDKLLLVLSGNSVASQWVEQEVETALERERRENRLVLFPIRLDNFVVEIEGGWPALIRNTRNIGDFTSWKEHDAYQRAFERLMRDLKAETTQSEE